MDLLTFIFRYAHEVPEPDLTVLQLTKLELTFLLHAVWEPAKHGDVVAQGLFRKIKAAFALHGIAWSYGEPWRLG